MNQVDSFKSNNLIANTQDHTAWEQLPRGSFQVKTKFSLDELKAKMAQGNMKAAVLTHEGLWVQK